MNLGKKKTIKQDTLLGMVISRFKRCQDTSIMKEMLGDLSGTQLEILSEIANRPGPLTKDRQKVTEFLLACYPKYLVKEGSQTLPKGFFQPIDKTLLRQLETSDRLYGFLLKYNYHYENFAAVYKKGAQKVAEHIEKEKNVGKVTFKEITSIFVKLGLGRNDVKSWLEGIKTKNPYRKK